MFNRRCTVHMYDVRQRVNTWVDLAETPCTALSPETPSVRCNLWSTGAQHEDYELIHFSTPRAVLDFW